MTDPNDPSGSPQTWTYDGNGNLLSDGYYLYVYDHLDRLSEVYVLTYPGGGTDTEQGQAVVRVFAAPEQKRRDGKETAVPVQLWREQVAQARQRVQGARASSGSSAGDPRLPFGVNAGTTGTAAAAVDEPVPVLVAYYGYDPSNRRVGKMLPDFSGAFYAWSAWDLAEAYDLGFVPTTVWFEGGVTDEHLGYAWRNPSTGAWVRHGYVMDHTRGIAGVADSAGVVVEQYEYEPYGCMSVLSPGGGVLGSAPTVPGQVYGFAGRQMDPETGLLYYRNRYYQPTHGRFMTSDPAGAWVDPQASGNGYAYCGSAPTIRLDPLGLFTVHIVVMGGENNDQFIEGAIDSCERDPDGGIVVIVDANGGWCVTVVPGGQKPPTGQEPMPGVVRLMLTGHGWAGNVGGAMRGHLTSENSSGWRRIEGVVLDLLEEVASSGCVGEPVLVNVCFSSDPLVPAQDRFAADVSKRTGLEVVGHDRSGRLLNGVLCGSLDAPTPENSSDRYWVDARGRTRQDTDGYNPRADQPNDPALLGYSPDAAGPGPVAFPMRMP